MNLDSWLVPLGGVLLAMLAWLTALWSRTQLVRALGWWSVPLTTGWLGVPVHETAHVLAAWSMLRKVERIQWFAPDAETGSLGAVTWQPGRPPLNWLAVLWVGLAPLLGGVLGLQGLLALIATLLQQPLPAPPPSADIAAWQQAAQHLATWAVTATRTAWATHPLATIAAWWAIVSIAAHMTPSRADLQGTWRGALLVLGVAAGAIAACHYTNIKWQPVAQSLAVWLAWSATPGLLLAVAAHVPVGGFAWLISQLRGR